ncbi:Ubiquitin conjugation factor [Drechslerella dactyloides]|uniref:Ubiquitin conjugation factor n=1 Tax=Drechslerella dactyloides TaxID=74499 RepID=A0AAD6NMN2_DREDA|nr:Ubiquitin conjugation factor [Drechslerella dactyloides]
MDNPLDTEAIRLKRLARLGASLQNPQNGPSAPLHPPPVATSRLDTPGGSLSVSQPQHTSAPEELYTPSLKRPVSPSEDQSTSTRSKSSMQDNTMRTASGPSLDEWEDNVIAGTFRVTEGSPDEGYLYLQDLSEEIKTQGRSIDLSISVTSSGICVDFCGHALVELDIFDSSSKPFDLAGDLLKSSDLGPSISPELLRDLSETFQTNKELEQVFLDAFKEMSVRLRDVELVDDYQTYTNALYRIVTIKPMAILFTTSPIFLPQGLRPPDLEVETLLGPYFRLSPLQGRVVEAYYPSPKTQPSSALNLASSSLRLTTQNHQEVLSAIINHLVRASAEARGRVLDFFATVLNLNSKRRALQIQENTVSSDGFLLNITAILNKLCDPFMDATYTKVDKIDVRYFKQNPRVQIREETKINSDQASSDAFYEAVLEGKPNFNSEVFFLNVVAHHVGYIASINNAVNLSHHLSDLEKNLERLEHERERFLNSPQLSQLDNSIKLLKERIQKGYSYQAAIEGLLSDEGSQLQALSFMNYLTVWLLRLISPMNDYPQKALKLPLPATAPAEFSNLPEYMIEDATAVFCHVVRSYPPRVTNQQSEAVMTLAVALLRMSNYIKNPYLKAKLVEALYIGISPIRSGGGDRGVLGDLLNGHTFALDNLMHSLMSFYIEVEQTGAHTQFYDKFNIRYNISQVIKSIWRNPNYREKLGQESRVNPDFFVRFVALLLNDVTYLLDESLSKLSEIHRLQIELEEPSNPNMEPTVRQERERTLASNEHHATTYVSLANETVRMVKMFTAAVPDAFVSPELVHRLAGMLDYNLVALVGPKCSNLRVRGPQKYRFDPKTLLSEMISIYLNLGTRPDFVRAIAADGRSYSSELFPRAYSILAKIGKSPEELLSLKNLSDAVADAKKATEQGEEELGEIPDEFLDPLLFTLMENPVILPTSKTTIDLSTIKAHLLSDPTDPFNRSPLKLEDIVPDVELKDKIEAFKAERRSKSTG